MSPSPPAKRMRLSSPTVGELRRRDVDARDALHQPTEEADSPFQSHTPAQSTRIYASFTSARVADRSYKQSDEDEPPSEVDYAAWFHSDSSRSCVGFSAATTAMPGFQRPSAKGEFAKSLFVPSAAALREAEEKMKKWQEEIQPVIHIEPDSHRTIQTTSPPRASFSSARGAHSFLHVLETPTPVPLFRSAHSELTPSRSSDLLQAVGSKRQTKPFISPLIAARTHLPPHRQVPTPSFRPLGDCHSSFTVPSQPHLAISPLSPSLVVNHVASQKPLGFTPRHGSATMRPKFVTPFKAVVKSTTPSASARENITLPSTPTNPRTVVNRVYPPSVSSLPRPSKRTSDERRFDLTAPSGRKTLAASGLRPQTYSAKEIEDMGINFEELRHVNPLTAPFYTFSARSCSLPSSSDPSSSLALGRTTVLEELHAKSCTLAEQAWVDNHWPLILWKLAGMASLDPTSESDPLRKRWCWPEVIRQLMYRYERDLNSSSRPPLRLITTRDASVESPMVLCISDIIWPADRSGEDTMSARSQPELEVTDGWYRLRARIDAPLTRGINKGKIKVGRKIAVAGAKLAAERTEGSEILEAYGSNALLLTGNSTHMAPWHAKLGFQRGPFVATLNSLTADGGNVAIMMLAVIKAYPVAYIEFVAEGLDGRKQRVGPHDSKEELQLSTQWKAKREHHASRLWTEYEKRKCRLLDCAERLEQRAGLKFRINHDDDPPDKIYDIYDTLQEDIEAAKSVISSISPEDAGWLARHIRERGTQVQDTVSREIEQELESICPSRDVKAFCVIVVNDARTYKHPPRRTAQVTVWDVPGVSVPEGCSQSPFVPGQQYFVTNLVPTQASAWMDRSSDGEVYLSTKNNSTWTLVK